MRSGISRSKFNEARLNEKRPDTGLFRLSGISVSSLGSSSCSAVGILLSLLSVALETLVKRLLICVFSFVERRRPRSRPPVDIVKDRVRGAPVEGGRKEDIANPFLRVVVNE